MTERQEWHVMRIKTHTHTHTRKRTHKHTHTASQQCNDRWATRRVRERGREVGRHQGTDGVLWRVPVTLQDNVGPVVPPGSINELSLFMCVLQFR